MDFRIKRYRLSIRRSFIDLLNAFGVSLSCILVGILFHSLGPAYVICLLDWASLLCERAIWLRLFDLKLLERLVGKRSCCNFHMCFACFKRRVSSRGRMDSCLKRGMASSSWDLKLIIYHVTYNSFIYVCYNLLYLGNEWIWHLSS